MRGPERVAIVTGATAGIGLYTALGLARQGMRIVVVGRGPDRDRVRRFRQPRRSAPSGRDIAGTA